MVESHVKPDLRRFLPVKGQRFKAREKPEFFEASASENLMKGRSLGSMMLDLSGKVKDK